MKRFKIHSSDDVPTGSVQTPIVYVKQKVSWQYKKLVQDADKITEEALNRLGEDGWELVSVSTNGADHHLYFKRLIEE